VGTQRLRCWVAPFRAKETPIKLKAVRLRRFSVFGETGRLRLIHTRSTVSEPHRAKCRTLPPLERGRAHLTGPRITPHHLSPSITTLSRGLTRRRCRLAVNLATHSERLKLGTYHDPYIERQQALRVAGFSDLHLAAAFQHSPDLDLISHLRIN
jgi:hypothetical protein